MNDNLKLHEGDCREVLRGLDDEVFDSCVTDPPYELGFMGKGWDKSGVAYDVGVWREAYRVLKPGAFLLAFGGSRTYHRLACAIEDAGFEVRDQIMWVYASGFPKSHNIGCKCSGGMLPYTHEKAEPKTECDLYPLRNPNVPQAVDIEKRGGEVLQPKLPEQSSPVQQSEPAEDVRPGQPRLERRSDILAKTWKLQTDQVRSMPGAVSYDGPERRIHNGASPIDGAILTTPFTSDGSGPPQESQPAGQSTGKPRTVRLKSGPQDSRICPKCGGIIDRVGYGSALKPAYEPIIIARKPLSEKNIISNVLKYGTGAMNVDGCRVEVDPVADHSQLRTMNRSRKIENNGWGMNQNGADIPQVVSPLGRWPANFIHDGSEEVVGLFPVSKGQQGDVRGTEKSHTGDANTNCYGEYGRVPAPKRIETPGSAARFFYCAKASRSERGEGNIHPTVKPLALMRYLCRLVTPPDGLVLDPFCGSGSTLLAARDEGFGCVGIDLDTSIASKRIASRPIEPEDPQLGFELQGASYEW